MDVKKQRAIIAETINGRAGKPIIFDNGYGTFVYWFNNNMLPWLPDIDLNAMHEAEKTLGHFGESHEYWKNLCSIAGFSWDGNVQWQVVFATASQRAKAFLKTIGKWEE